MNQPLTDNGKRRKTLMLAAAGLLLILNLGGVLLATRPDPAQQASFALSGAAIGTLSPAPSFSVGVAYALRPMHLGGAKLYLSRVPWSIAGGGSYVVLWDWDASQTSTRLWKFVESGYADYHIYAEEQKSGCTDTLNPDCYDRYYLAVRDSSQAEMADVIAFPTEGGSNHAWIVTRYTDKSLGISYYQIKNFNSNLCLTIREKGTANGAALSR